MKQLIIITLFFYSLISSLALAQSNVPATVERIVPIIYYLLHDEPESRSPVVSFQTPSAGATYAEGEAVSVSVSASDSDGTIAKVDLYVDDVVINSDVNAPYAWTLENLSAGTRTLRAVATDNLGKTSQVSRSIVIEAVNVAPAVSFAAPSAQTITEGDSVVVDVLASDSDGSIARVELYVDGVFVRQEVIQPYTWNDTTRGGADPVLDQLNVGTHTLRAVATDNEGLSSEVSLSIDVVAAPVNQAPTVSFSTPQADQTFAVGDPVAVEALATDDVAVQNVALYVDDIWVRVESFAPYTWNDTNNGPSDAVLNTLSAGEHTLRIVATDDTGLRNETSITIDVIEQLPVSNELANRVSGVAPLAVKFDSGAEDDEFHDRLYNWEFGDPDSGNWAGVDGTIGLSRNTDTGPISAHLYAKPGTYTATLKVSDASGVIAGLSRQVTITVEDPNIVFSGNATKCISSSGDFNGCPTGAEQLRLNDAELSADISNLLNDNGDRAKRVLLRRGDRWNITYPNTNFTLGDNIYLAAYGECLNPDARQICGNAPILNNASEGGLLKFIALSENITIQDIHLTASDRRYGSIRGISTRDVTLYRLKNTVSGGIGNFEHRNFSLVDSDITGGHTILVFAGGRNMIFQGNHIHDSYSGHLLRIPMAYRSLISHNVIHSTEVDPQRGSRGSHVLKLHSMDADYLNELPYLYNTLGVEPSFTQYVYIANNFFGKGGDWPVSIDPQNTVNDELVSHIILEKNIHSCGYGNDPTIGTLDRVPSNSCSQLLAIQAANVTVRNSIFDLQDAGTRHSDNRVTYPAAIAVKRRNAVTVAPAPTNVNVYNNTIRIPTDEIYFNTSPHWIDVGVDATNTRFSNNLINKPSSDATRYLRDLSGTAIEINNLFVDAAGFIDDSSATPVQNRNYRLKGSSPALNTGTTIPSVIDDFDGTIRGNSQYDIGAYEQ